MVTPAQYKAMLPKKSNRSDETKLCIAFREHCEKYFPRTPGVLEWTHIANEGRSPQEGDKLKKMGVHAGWFDYIFEAPNLTCHLEAKVHGRDYSDSQKTFHYFVSPMAGKRLGKFYSVEEGHNLLISMGIIPIMPCKYFKEPNFQTEQEKFQQAHNFFAPIKL